MMDATDDPLELTPRQRDILDLLAEGLTAVETATVLGIAPRTVRAHCETLRRKLNVNRTRRLPAAYRTLTSGAVAALEAVDANSYYANRGLTDRRERGGTSMDPDLKPLLPVIESPLLHLFPVQSREVVLLTVEIWPSGTAAVRLAALDAAGVEADATVSDETDTLFRRLRVAVRDEEGVEYSWRGSAWGGSGNEWRGDWFLTGHPSLPRSVTVSVASDDGHEVEHLVRVLP